MSKPKYIEKECKNHGLTSYVLIPSSGYYKCRKCQSANVQRRREKVKRMAVEYKGGSCADCGLVTEYLGAYDFHHKDPNEKDFGIAHKGATRAWAKIQEELDKCVMLCATCHRIRHEKEKIGDGEA